MAVETQPSTAKLSTAELKLLVWIRQHAIPFGTLEGKLQVDFQDGRAVMIRVYEQVKEERFR